MSLIECRGLTRIYHQGDEEIKPLDAIDLEIDAGGFVSLMGPSGSGKTTLLNLLAGIDRPTSGSLRVGDAQLEALSRGRLAAWRADNIGYIFQLYNLIPVLTAYENVELPLLLKPITSNERHQRVSAALDVVGIADRSTHFPRQLSGGQEQRVAIARAIVTEPTLLLADEPTGDLDRESALSVMELLLQLNREHGRTIVMVTHDARTAEYADTSLHLEKGRLLESGVHVQ